MRPNPVLELRPNCELCDRDLPPDSSEARICSYECTFCADCVDTVLHNVCPNCGGELVPRPVRPRQEWRPGSGLAHHPPAEARRRLRYERAEVEELSRRLRHVPPRER